MKEEYIAITNDVYTIQETDQDNVFLFFRNDGGLLGDIGRAPIELYQTYISQMMMKGKIPARVMALNIYYEKSADGKYVTLIALVPGNHPEKHEVEPKPDNKQPNFFKRILRRLFG